MRVRGEDRLSQTVFQTRVPRLNVLLVRPARSRIDRTRDPSFAALGDQGRSRYRSSALAEGTGPSQLHLGMCSPSGTSSSESW
jgi:hypothetical protein